ncbi:hypothetical protein ABIA33_002205 [Streptacidiphilus sp. MAP12-16]
MTVNQTPSAQRSVLGDTAADVSDFPTTPPPYGR